MSVGRGVLQGGGTDTSPTAGRGAGLAVLALAAILALTGCYRLFPGLFVPRPALGGQWLVIRTAPPAAPDSASADARRTVLELGLGRPHCFELEQAIPAVEGRIYVLVPDAVGLQAPWPQVIGVLQQTGPAALVGFEWDAAVHREILAEQLATGVSRICECLPDAEVVLLAHGEGGVLASFAAHRISVPPQGRPQAVRVVTVAAPLAGYGETPALGRPSGSLAYDVEAAINAYPPAAPGVGVWHLRTSFPADARMQPGIGGHLPNRADAGVPGATQVALPGRLDRPQALRFAAHELAADAWFDEGAVLVDTPAMSRPTCRLPDEIIAAGDIFETPSFDEPPSPERHAFWSGADLPLLMPDPSAYVRCRPCQCAASHALEPWDAWQEINRRAYERLRSGEAPYPVAVVPGYHGGGYIAEVRIEAALRLLELGWVASIMVSGGHRRSGNNEAYYLLELARRLAAEHQIDVTDRIFVEPCAVKTLTNLRNGLRMMQALGIDHGLLVTDSKRSGQAFVFHNRLDMLVARDLGCELGRVSFLLGESPLPRLTESSTGCQPPLGWGSNPVTFLVPDQPPSVFWISPRPDTAARGALDCVGGAGPLLRFEPDDQDPLHDACLPLVDQQGLGCVRDAFFDEPAGG